MSGIKNTPHPKTTMTHLLEALSVASVSVHSGRWRYSHLHGLVSLHFNRT